jgi:hypothetical protein
MTKSVVKVGKLPVPVVDTRVARHMLMLRGERVLLDIHLSELYDVETRALKQAVRRNKHRFPADFMFTLKEAEIKEAVANGFIPSIAHLGGAKPFAFTEGGVAMLSSVLNSKRAIAMNVAIMRTFIALRKLSKNYTAIVAKLKEMEGKYDEQFKEVFDLLHQLLDPPVLPRKRIGFRQKGQRE